MYLKAVLNGTVSSINPLESVIELEIGIPLIQIIQFFSELMLDLMHKSTPSTAD